MTNIIELETIDSTNTYAKKLASEGAANGTVVWAHEQTAGRGRQSNTWESPVGNLYMSLILHPEVDTQYIGQLAFLSAVALLNVLEDMLPKSIDINLKWPNDILIDNQKLAGILIESDSVEKWVVVGIGVNIASAPIGCAALSDIGYHPCTTEDLMQKLTNEFGKLMQQWQNEGFGDIRERWLSHAYNISKEIVVKVGNNIVIGMFRGIDESGNLLLEPSDGSLQRINSAEVFL